MQQHCMEERRVLCNSRRDDPVFAARSSCKAVVAVHDKFLFSCNGSSLTKLKKHKRGERMQDENTDVCVYYMFFSLSLFRVLHFLIFNLISKSYYVFFFFLGTCLCNKNPIHIFTRISLSRTAKYSGFQ